MLITENQNHLKVLDVSVLVTLGGAAGLASPLIERVITLYQQEATTMVEGISTALAMANLEQAFRLAHTLKSSSATIGAYALADIAKQIEQAAKQQQATQFSMLVEKLHTEYQRLTAVLAAL